VRGFIIGLVVLAVACAGVLSIRPGGLRNQLRNVARRLRICLVLIGIYMVASAALRIFVANTTTSELASAGVGLVLALVFVLLAQERPLAR
jgi:NAD(P)H-hydrate repair Nnr-like enzyme with NAD(P)H-hydrate dehydratase domain